MINDRLSTKITQRTNSEFPEVPLSRRCGLCAYNIYSTLKSRVNQAHHTSGCLSSIGAAFFCCRYILHKRLLLNKPTFMLLR